MFDVVIIGAGVIGGMLARTLSRYRLSVCLVEKASDVANGASKANSGIIHGGYDPLPHTLKAKLNTAGVPLLYKAADELHVPYRRTGSLVCAFGAEEEKTLAALFARGKENGIDDLRLLSGDEARAMEPALSAEVTGALLVPSAGVICPYMLTIAAVGNAMDNGVTLLRDFAVCGIDRDNDGFAVHAENGDTVRGRFVANCAGGFADKISAMAGDTSFTLIPRAGEYMLLDKKVGGMLSRTVFQLPTKMGKGVLVTPTVHGNLLMGPTAVDVEDPGATNTTAAGLESVMQRARKSVPSLPGNRTITSFAGLRAHVEKDEHDFIIGEAEGAPGFLNAVGIESPGLSAAPAIGAFLAESAAYLVSAPANKKYDSTRPEVFRPNEMTVEERAAFVAEHPLYGNIVCRCEQVTEGEIVDAIHRVPGARSLDGVKRRTRAGMGRCQAGFCSPRVLEILSRELGVPQEQLTKSGGASFPIVGKTRKDGENA